MTTQLYCDTKKEKGNHQNIYQQENGKINDGTSMLENSMQLLKRMGQSLQRRRVKAKQQVAECELGSLTFFSLLLTKAEPCSS